MIKTKAIELPYQNCNNPKFPTIFITAALVIKNHTKGNKSVLAFVTPILKQFLKAFLNFPSLKRKYSAKVEK